MNALKETMASTLKNPMRSVSAGLMVACLMLFASNVCAAALPNILLITVDDMSTDSVGSFGSSVADTTPHIDQLAAEGLRFTQAHVQVANCMPSRNVMWSGRYPHTSRVEGFYHIWDADYPTLSELLHDAGYFTAIRGKVRNSTPYIPYQWDKVLDATHERKDPASYGVSTLEGIRAARAAKKPFALLINISDPHVPFYGLDRRGSPIVDAFTPSRVYRPDEVAVPGFLIDDPIVREELAHYYSSVRRADDAVGFVLDALAQSGEAESTLVMFISDHGMPFPFAKTQLYHHSTRTPLVFRWPGKIAPGQVDTKHMVSAVDVLPSLLDAAGIDLPVGLQGRSFLPLLEGTEQTGWDYVIKEYNENSAGQRAPMRAIQDERYLYIFNPWSDGKRTMSSATRNTQTYKRMLQLSTGVEELADRLHLLQYRVTEELYDVQVDPDCLVNLIADPDYASELERLRGALEAWMRNTEDPVLIALVHRDDPQFLARFMSGVDDARAELIKELKADRQRAFAEAIGRALLKKQAASGQAPPQAEQSPSGSELR